MREELSLILSNIKVTAPLEYIRSVSDVVQKLLRLCRELFADHLALVGEMVAEVGQILKENGQAESVKVCQLDNVSHHKLAITVYTPTHTMQCPGCVVVWGVAADYVCTVGLVVHGGIGWRL